MKARKIAGERLITYLEKGIHWKEHKDKVLDFWINFKAKDSGFSARSLKDMFYYEELPEPAQVAYEEWFEEYDFNNADDKNWIDFVNGTFNIFYQTENPRLQDDDTWYIILMKSEDKANGICESQTLHGNPNLQTFWKIDTNSKSEEVGGRRNGYIYADKLAELNPAKLKDQYWAVVFQCPDTVSLDYLDSKDVKSKMICWAADAENLTKVKITSSRRLIIEQVFVEGKVWKKDRLVPQEGATNKAFNPKGLENYLNKNYAVMYGFWDAIDEEMKARREAENARRSAVNTMNDEEVNIDPVIPMTVNQFVDDGNVSLDQLDKNKQIRQNVKKKNQLRDREIRKKVREKKKDKSKQVRRDKAKVNPFLANK
jgi:hypothetical protein